MCPAVRKASQPRFLRWPSQHLELNVHLPDKEMYTVLFMIDRAQETLLEDVRTWGHLMLYMCHLDRLDLLLALACGSFPASNICAAPSLNRHYQTS